MFFYQTVFSFQVQSCPINKQDGNSEFTKKHVFFRTLVIRIKLFLASLLVSANLFANASLPNLFPFRYRRACYAL